MGQQKEKKIRTRKKKHIKNTKLRQKINEKTTLNHMYQNHSQSNQGTLAHKVSGVLKHRFQQVGRFGQASPSTRDTQSHGSSVPDMRVVGLGKKFDHSGHAVVFPEEDETQAQDSDTSHIVADITDSDVQQFPYSFVAACSDVRHGDGQDTTISHGRIGVVEKTVDELICAFLAAIHDQSHANGETSNDLVMLSIVSMLDHIGQDLGVARTEHDKTHC